MASRVVPVAPRWASYLVLRPIPADDVGNDVGEALGVVDAELAAGAELDDHQVRNGLAGPEVEVGRHRYESARWERRQVRAGRGLGGGEVDDDRRHTRCRHAAMTGSLHVARPVRAQRDERAGAVEDAGWRQRIEAVPGGGPGVRAPA